MTDLTFVQAVRDFIDLNPDATSSYSDQTIGSNIRTASWFLERATNRIFGDVTATKKYTTNGGVYVTIPGLRTATSVELNGVALTADESYWLIPDNQQSGVYTGIQLAGFQQRAGDFDPRAFDVNLRRVDRYSSLPNDLVVAGEWGYEDADLPDPAARTAVILSAFLTKYPDAVLVGVSQTADGSTIDLSGFPLPVQQFVTDWRVPVGAGQA